PRRRRTAGRRSGSWWSCRSCGHRPEMLKGVGAEGSPAFGQALGGLSPAVEAEALEGAADTEVGGEEGVVVAEGAHGDVAGGPGADAGELEEAGWVGAWLEVQFVGGEGAREGLD